MLCETETTANSDVFELAVAQSTAMFLNLLSKNTAICDVFNNMVAKNTAICEVLKTCSRKELKLRQCTKTLQKQMFLRNTPTCGLVHVTPLTALPLGGVL